VGGREPDGGGHPAEHERLGEQLHDDPTAARAEGAPHDDLALARRRPREQQQGHVAADEHEEHQDEDLHQRQQPELIRLHRRRAAEHLRVRHHLGLQVLVRVWPLPGRSLAERRELRLRLAERRAGGESPEDGDAGSAAWRIVEHARAKRCPRVVRDRKREAVRHHAHHGGVRLSELHGPPDDLRVAREARLPHVVAKDHHRRRSGLLVRRHEGAAQQRRRRSDPEPRRGDRRDLHREDLPVTPLEVACDVLPRPEVGHRPHRLAPDTEVVRRARLRVARLHVPVPQVHDAVALRQRQRGTDEQHHHLEYDDADPDGERHRESADDGQPRILDQHPAAELEVERQPAEPPQPPRVPPRLPVLLHPAELSRRLPARLRGVQTPLALEPLRFHVHVEAHLLVHLRPELVGPPQPAPERPHPREQSLHAQISRGVVRSDSAMASASRFQLATSSPKRARPAGVRW
jgi:hypothetical protein